MNRRIRDARILFSLLLLLSALSTAPAACAQTAVAPAPARVEAVAFESKLVGKPLPYNVVLPTDYALTTRAGTRYPVLYLLHGLGGGAGDWVSARARLAEHAALYQIIVVVPEGKDGWYTDSATTPR